MLTAMGGIGLGAAAAGVLGGAASAAPETPELLRCSTILAPEEIEGPYYIQGEQLRSDITEGKPGVPVELSFTLVDVKRCVPLPNASVDVWHCDALGYYSGFTANDPDSPALAGDDGVPTDDLTFCRGVQVSDTNGLVVFRTIYPGWYYGRTIHIHVKVYTGGREVHTGQLYFQDQLTAQVAALDPYRTHQFRRWRNSEDFIYLQQGGASSVLKVTQVRPGSVADGLRASISLGLNVR
ncbi:hypothetical protein GCM10010174_17720 [Kutzneria viridogrisea]